MPEKKFNYEQKFFENFYEENNVTKPSHLVIFLHGYGANGQNLLSLAQEFKQVLPSANFISPNAIEPWEGGFPDAYQWFSLNNGFGGNNLDALAKSIRNANKILQKFIEDQLARFSLTHDKLFLVGFSQGAMMSLYQGLIAPKKIAGVIAYSGKLILPEMVGEKTLSKPQTCLIHGESDSVLPFENFLEAKKILQAQEIIHEAHAISGLDHSIDVCGVRTAQNFFKSIIKKNS